MNVPVEILQWYLLSLRRCGLIQRLKNCIDIIDFFCSTMTIEMFGAAFKPWVDGIPFDNSNPSTRIILNIKRNYFMQNHRGKIHHIFNQCALLMILIFLSYLLWLLEIEEKAFFLSGHFRNVIFPLCVIMPFLAKTNASHQGVKELYTLLLPLQTTNKLY